MRESAVTFGLCVDRQTLHMRDIKIIFWFHSLYVLMESARIVNTEQLKLETRSDNQPGSRVSVEFNISLFRCSAFRRSTVSMVSAVPVVSFRRFGFFFVFRRAFRGLVHAYFGSGYSYAGSFSKDNGDGNENVRNLHI